MEIEIRYLLFTVPIILSITLYKKIQYIELTCVVAST